MTSNVSYKEAALLIGCTHHYVRMLTSRGILQVAERIEVRPNVLKVFLDRDSVVAYMESRRRRERMLVRVTRDEKKAVEALLEQMRKEALNGTDWQNAPTD